MGKKLVIVLGIIGILTALGLSRLLLSMREAGGDGLTGTRPGSLTYRLERLDEAIAGLDAVEPALPKVTGDFAALEKDYALAAALTPGKMDLDAAIRYLTDIARKTEVDLASITPEEGPVRTAGNIEAWRVHVVLAGGFNQLAAFIDAVENPVAAAATAPRLIDVTDLAVAGDTADGYHECSVVVQLYRYEDAGETPDDPPATGLAEMLAAQRSRFAIGERDPMRMHSGDAALPGEEAAPTPPPPESPAPEAPLPDAPASESTTPGTLDDHAEPSLPGLHVDGISWSPGESRAVVNGTIYRSGDSLAGRDDVRIESIEPKAVVFDHNGERIRIPVRMLSREGD